MNKHKYKYQREFGTLISKEKQDTLKSVLTVLPQGDCSDTIKNEYILFQDDAEAKSITIDTRFYDLLRSTENINEEEVTIKIDEYNLRTLAFNRMMVTCMKTLLKPEKR